MKKEFYGNMSTGEKIDIVTLENENCHLSVINYGASIVSFKPFGIDIIGGFSCMAEYEADTSNQGAAVGRVANRIANARFTMDGAIYMLPANNNGHCLHGGRGFNRRVWNFDEVTENSVTLSYYSADGEEGFPSGLLTKVKYTLDGTTLIIGYEAIPEGKTPIALTNHSYFNLDGFGDTIYDHDAIIYADHYTAVDSTLIPTGVRPDVRGTVFDFTTSHKIGERIGEKFGGYDHNYVLNPTKFEEFLGNKLGLCAEVAGKKLKMSVYTDQPGVQFYIGNFLGTDPDPAFRGDIKKIRHGAFCLETQTEPNCVNHGIGFYDAGEVYRHNTVYKVELK